MNIKINAAEEAIIKKALTRYQPEVSGSKQWNTIVDVLNKINEAGIVKAARTPRVIPRKQYMFSFTEGGWNTVWAKTLKGAKRQALLEYKDSMAVVDLNTVHLATEDGIRSAASLFY